MDYLVDLLLNFDGPVAYLIVFGVLLLCGLGLPIPEDITLVAGGMMAYYGVCDVRTMIAVCMLGVMLGDSIIYFLGFKFGRALTRKKFFARLVSEERLDLVAERFRTRGNKLLFAARFMPGLRAPIFFSAGTLHVPYWAFFLYDGVAALISVPLIVGAVYRYGDHLDMVVRGIQNAQYGILAVIVSVIALITVKWYLQHRKLKRAG